MEGRHLNHVDVQHIIKETTVLFQRTVTSTLHNAVNILQGSGCQHTSCLDALIETASSSLGDDIFAPVKSDYLRQKYFTERMGMISPRKVLLPDSPNYFGRVRTGKPQAQKVQSFMVVSLIEQLRLLLKSKCATH